MLGNYLKIAWRNLWKYKTFSIINIGGLAIGISVAMLMLIHVKQELSYETAFPKHEQIYRVASSDWAKMSPLVAAELLTEMTEIKQIGRLYDIRPQVMSNNKLQIALDHCYAADQEIINIFDFQFLFGNPIGALDDPNSLVLTQKLSNKLFEPNLNPVGKHLILVKALKYE